MLTEKWGPNQPFSLQRHYTSVPALEGLPLNIENMQHFVIACAVRNTNKEADQKSHYFWQGRRTSFAYFFCPHVRFSHSYLKIEFWKQSSWGALVKIKAASRWRDHRVSQTVGKSVATPRWAVLVVNLASLFALWSNCSAARVEIYNLTAHITQDSGAAVHLQHRRRRTRGAAGTKGQSESANGGAKHWLSLSEFCLWTGTTHFVLKNYHWWTLQK